MQKEKVQSPEDEVVNKGGWKHLVGFEQDQASVLKLLKEDRLPSVMLFEGRAGIGKRSFLLYLAAMHFCEFQSACGQCSACQRVASSRHPDVMIAKGDGGGALKVSSIAEIGEFISYSPQSQGPHSKRVVLIFDAELLTQAAVNKLLKTLEEPAPSARILLTSSNKRQLLPTLLSRCVQWHLRPPSPELVASALKKLPALEAYSETEIKDWSVRFGNSPARVLSFLEQGENAQGAEDLLRCRKVGEVLSFAESFRQNGEQNLQDFLSEFEYALNRAYKGYLGDRTELSLGNIRARRLFLKELKTLVNKQRIAINPQLTVEKLGFFNFQIPVGHGRS